MRNQAQKHEGAEALKQNSVFRFPRASAISPNELNIFVIRFVPPMTKSVPA
jgi:hypothetical protein